MNSSWMLEASFIGVFFIIFSFIAVAITWAHAYLKLRFYFTKDDDPEVNPFWIASMFGSEKFERYLIFSIAISGGIVIVDYIMPLLILDTYPWWWNIRSFPSSFEVFPQLLTFFAAVIGFLGCWKIYHYLKNEVLEDMIKKAERSSKPTEIRRTLKMFVLVAGGSPIYQIACSITVILFFIYLHLYYIFPQW